MPDSTYLPLNAENIRRVNRVFFRRSDHAISFSIHDASTATGPCAINVCIVQNRHDDRRLLSNESCSLVFCAQLLAEIGGSKPEMNWDETCAWSRARMNELGIPEQPGTMPTELNLPPYLGDLFKLLRLFTGKDFSRYELKPPHDDPLFIGEDV